MSGNASVIGSSGKSPSTIAVISKRPTVRVSCVTLRNLACPAHARRRRVHDGPVEIGGYHRRMNGSMLAHAFGHHTWANLSVLDVCSALPEERLTTPVPAIYGSILDTLRHIVG